jgi:hypothetical protein
MHAPPRRLTGAPQRASAKCYYSLAARRPALAGGLRDGQQGRRMSHRPRPPKGGHALGWVWGRGLGRARGLPSARFWGGRLLTTLPCARRARAHTHLPTPQWRQRRAPDEGCNPHSAGAAAMTRALMSRRLGAGGTAAAPTADSLYPLRLLGLGSPSLSVDAVIRRANPSRRAHQAGALTPSLVCPALAISGHPQPSHRPFDRV